MSGSVAQGAAATGLPSAEFGELVRALAGTFDRAQKRLAVRQEQLLSALRAETNLAKLHVKLPNGNTVALSPIELCTPARGYLQDMVVDLRCVVEELQSQGSQRLGLRVLSVPQQSQNSLPLRLWFAEDNPIKVELRVAGEVVRALSLYDADLPSQESGHRTQQASVLLLHEEDVNWAAKYAVRSRATPDLAEPVIMMEAEPEVELSRHEMPKDSQTVVRHQEADSQHSFFVDAQGTSRVHGKVAVAPAPIDRTVPEQNGPVGEIPLSIGTARPERKHTARRTAIAGVVGLLLCAVVVGVKYGPQLRRKHRPVEPVPASSSVRPQSILVPVQQRDDVEPPPAGEPLPTVTTKTTSSTALRVRFFATSKDGVKTISCEGKNVPLIANGASGLLEARAELQPGESCTAIGDGKERHYSYREFLSESTSTASERSKHVRFHKN